MSTKNKIICISVAILVLLAIGFFLGRKSVKVRIITRTEYVPGEPIHDSIPKPYPVVKEAKVDTTDLFKYCIDNHLYDFLLPVIEKEKIVYEKVDTMKILAKFFEYHKYNVELFNSDTLGRLNVYPEVQYNELAGISYDFVPMQKVTENTIVKEKSIEPFIGAGIGLNNSAIVQAGLFMKNGFGVSGYYQRDFNAKTSSGGVVVLYKF